MFVAMFDALPPSDLRNLRNRAILLLGFAGGLRRSEIVGLSEEHAVVEEFRPARALERILGAHDDAWENRLARGRDRPRLEG